MSKREELPADPVIEAYKVHVDRTLLRENLRLTPVERLRKHEQMRRFVSQHRGAARRSTNDLEDLLRRLVEAEVEFILIGGVAAVLHSRPPHFGPAVEGAGRITRQMTRRATFELA